MNEYTQGRIRINEQGARFLRELLNDEIHDLVVERAVVKSEGGDYHPIVKDISRARRILQEVDRTIQHHWPTRPPTDEG